MSEIRQTRRVIFVNRFFWPDISATSQMLTQLVTALGLPDVEVCVITGATAYGGGRIADSGSPSPGVRVIRVKSSALGRLHLLARVADYVTFTILAALAVLRQARRGDVIVALTDPPMLGVVLLPLVRLRQARLVNWLQDLFPEVAIEAVDVQAIRTFARLLLPVRNFALSRTDTNVAIGSRMRQYLVKQGISERRLAMCPNWADESEIVAHAPGVSPLRALLAKDARLVVGYSGNLGRAHDYLTILEAATELKDEPLIRFAVIGGGHGWSALKTAAAARGLRNIEFYAYFPRTQLSDSMAAIDVHLVSLLPSLETLIVPSKFYSICAAARPTVFIGSLDGEIAENIREAQCGTSVAVGDSAGLVKALREYANNPDLCRAHGAAARRCFESQFSRVRGVARWADVLRSLMAADASDVGTAKIRA